VNDLSNVVIEDEAEQEFQAVLTRNRLIKQLEIENREKASADQVTFETL